MVLLSKHFGLFLAIFAMLPSSLTALGINCQTQGLGLSDCSSTKGLFSILAGLIADASILDSSYVYGKNAWIGCFNNYCAQLINTDDNYRLHGDLYRALLAALTRNDCGSCGTVPLDPTNHNDIKDGAVRVSKQDPDKLPCPGDDGHGGFCKDSNGKPPSLNMLADFNGATISNPCPPVGSINWSIRDKKRCDYPGLTDQQILDSADL